MRSSQLFLLFLVPCFLACQQEQEPVLPILTSSAAVGQIPEKVTTATANIVFQSTDDGQTWQDISAGLPAELQVSKLFADNGQLVLSTSKGIYQNSITANHAHWEKEKSLEQTINTVSAGTGGTIAFSRKGRFFQKMDGMGIWMPVFTNFKSEMVRNVFTAGDGSIVIGCDDGFYRSSDQGKSWKHVKGGGWGIEIVESDGVLLSTHQSGILRSTDGGDHWDLVLSEGGVGIAVEVIEGGFAAISYNSQSQSRRVRTSTDGGKTWQAIDAGLPPSKLISSIQQLGDYFYCGHPDGIYRSADQGKSWDLLLPTIGEKVFNLFVADGVVYAVLQNGGC